jgi:Flp pilus assembly pilin Flp
MFFACLHAFCSDESGAAAIDWVVLTGAALLLGVLAAIPIGRGAVDLSEEAGTALASLQVPEIIWTE